MTADLPSGGRYPATALRVSSADVGRRVSVRRSLPGGGLGDVVGTLVRWSAGTVEVQRRDGSAVVLDEGDLVAGKVVPPPAEGRRARGTTGP